MPRAMYSHIRLLAILHILNSVGARVYCQDSHASPWVPFGYSCPVLCQNIINAIERLKIMDFQTLIYNKPYKMAPKKLQALSFNKDVINEIETDPEDQDQTWFTAKMNTYRKKNNIHLKNKIHDKVFKTTKTTNHTIDKNFYKDIIKLSQLAAKLYKGKCDRSKIGLVAMMKCARKSNIDGSFLKIITKLLNKYAKSAYKFTEQMSEVLLEKIFGENTDLRNNIFDVNKLLIHLRQALHTHGEHEAHDVIALGPKRCLTISLPGCFCKSGFVESSGQCVRPSDCVQDPMNDEYLARVVVT